MWDDEEETPDWGYDKKERPPSRLERKWEREIQQESGTVVCRSCGKRVKADALLCLYCGESTGVRAGLFSAIRHWLSTGWGIGVVLLILLSFLLIYTLF